MKKDSLTIGLISDVFFDDTGHERLLGRLREVKSRGGELAVLPELPLSPWSPATSSARNEDAEPPHGPRHMAQANAAKEVGIGLVGGVIVDDPDCGERRNRALVFDATGSLVTTFDKLHIPEEPGFWETSHYGPGDEPAQVIETFGLPVGIQICSDINRPQGAHVLAALGAAVIICPRATEQATWDRWRVVMRANAITSAASVVSVNRPGPEQDVLLGGPTIVVAPSGEVLLETTDPVAVATLQWAAIEKAKRDYPGYLPVRAGLYARSWLEVVEGPG